MAPVIEGLAEDRHRLDECINHYLTRSQPLGAGCQIRALVAFPASTDYLQRMVAATESGDAFSKGRDFAAWLGLVPK